MKQPKQNKLEVALPELKILGRSELDAAKGGTNRPKIIVAGDDYRRPKIVVN